MKVNETQQKPKKAAAPKPMKTKSVKPEKTSNKEKSSKKKIRKAKEKRSFLYYAWPPNLKAEIGVLGYEFGNKQIAIVYGALLGIMVLMGYLFKLPLVWQTPLIIAGLLFAPKVVQNTYKNKWEWTRFADVNTYIEQMLYAFKDSQKVLTALEDTLVLFPKTCAMYEVMDGAIQMIKNAAVSDKTVNIEEQALQLIEARYPNAHIKSLHRFMLKVESIGGNFDSSIQLLLENRQMWENRVTKLQDKRKKKRQEILGSCIASALLCMSMLYILPADVNIGEMTIVRIADVVMIILLVMVYLKADTKLSSNLIEPKKPRSEEKVNQDYEKYKSFDRHAGFMTSLKFTIIPVVGILIAFFVFHNKWGVMAGVLFTPVMLTQHIWGYKLLERRLIREIQIAFPEWLMEVALLMQADNVQVSIFKTVDHALPILKPELVKLRDGLMKNPNSMEPYENFFGGFPLPEKTTAMQKLYAMSMGTGNPEEQISNIVHRNNITLDRAEDMANEDSMAGLYTLFLAPVLIGSVVLMADMTCFLLYFMQNFAV